MHVFAVGCWPASVF